MLCGGGGGGEGGEEEEEDRGKFLNFFLFLI